MTNKTVNKRKAPSLAETQRGLLNTVKLKRPMLMSLFALVLSMLPL